MGRKKMKAKLDFRSKRTIIVTAIIAALDKVEEFIKEVKDNPENWIQYYKDI